MNKIIYCLISSAMMFSFAACDPQDNDSHSLGGQLVAESAVSFSVTTTENQNEYVFTNTSQASSKDVQLFWDFADGKVVATKAGDAVTMVYKKAGSYTVKLLAFTTAGQTEYSQTINVAEDIKDDSFKWTGFGYDNAANLFKSASFTNEFYYAPDWAQLANPTVTADGNKSFAMSFEKATSAQWQNQVHFVTNMAVASGKTYDFSVAIKASKSMDGATVKASKVGDDNTMLLMAEKSVSLKAGEVKVVSGTALNGFDGEVKVTFDFGGNPENMDVEIYNIVLMEHSDANVTPFDYNSSANVWKEVDDNQSFEMSYWWADADWKQIGNPDFDHDGNVYKITSKTATVAEWQAQNSFVTNSLAIAASDVLDFSCIIKATKDARVTIKLCDQADDENLAFYKKDIHLTANSVQAVSLADVHLAKGDASKVKLLFDFGGCEADTEFTIGDITLIKK